jgi:predicted enzyme related to lactoylglutathione lyase
MTDYKPERGSIAWTDLTVPDAKKITEFYRKVVGWTTSPVSMGDYSDFNMKLPETGKTVAGICHARGVNAELPPVWLVYIIVADLDKSLEQVQQLGGEFYGNLRDMGDQGRFAVIRDPAGAFCALFEPVK